MDEQHEQCSRRPGLVLAGVLLVAFGVGLLSTSSCLAPVCYRDNRLADDTLDRIADIGDFMRALDLIVEAKGAYDDVVEFREMDGLADVLAFAAADGLEQQAIEWAFENVKPLRQAKNTYEGLQTLPADLAAAVRSGDPKEIGRQARAGQRYLRAVLRILDSQVVKALVPSEDEARYARYIVDLRGDVRALGRLADACGASDVEPDQTHCGDPGHRPSKVSAAQWSAYECRIGDASEGCLSRRRYTSTPGMGCPGSAQVRCCPGG